ncbi:MAG: zinc ABC transporter substrate-binding protein [Desulfamplus sp.]|nr:zinc ABC transporter substrate-binding protein [Desulfamplus sp.]
MITLSQFIYTFSTIAAADITDKTTQESNRKTGVFVSILPQKFFVEQIGKQRVDVKVMVEPGASPHTYEPKPRQMAALSKTRIYFSVGLPFEKVWLGRILSANKDIKVVPTDEGIEKIHMTEHYHHDTEHEHKESGTSDNNNDSEPDPHIWLAPNLVILQAQHILRALKDIDPDHARFYDSNYKSFVSEIEKLDGQIKEILATKKGVKFMVFHPSWGYFAREYNLEQMPIEIEGKAPKPSRLQELINLARKKKISVIFAQPQFSIKNARQIAREINAEVVFADPLAYNWFDNLREVAHKFKSALQ